MQWILYLLIMQKQIIIRGRLIKIVEKTENIKVWSLLILRINKKVIIKLRYWSIFRWRIGGLYIAVTA